MATIKEQIKNATEDIRKAHMARAAQWAEYVHQEMTIRNTWKEVEWCEYLGLVPELKKKGVRGEYLGFPTGFFNTKKSRQYHTDKTSASSISRNTAEDYVSDQLKKEEKNLEAQLDKLVGRLKEKGLKVSTMKVIRASFNVNLEITITDGETTVTAWTIVASGPIQRPHYRYLVK
jgi:hypothetical protein